MTPASPIPYTFDDGGRVAAGKGSRSVRNGVYVKRKWFKDYMASLGFKWVPTMAIGTGCRVHLDATELPSGRIIVSLSRHYAAVIDGVLHDAYNCALRGVTHYPSDYLGNIPADAVRLPDGRGWSWTPRRCVYGYWEYRA